ncbi:hypothetical protein PVL29_013727 [Vitis rotundifolia]|uniref:Uncharacterized protein n=1 Tax=Vitis rotundifolia TaxID=103349 RepID=A0AA38ZM65_VITRO|nr:hypothetical protein PVL29_013727 [Vitis rotundifolia]
MNDGTYIGFMCFMSAGTVLTLAFLHPSLVVRDDGNHCTNIKYSDGPDGMGQHLTLSRPV